MLLLDLPDRDLLTQVTTETGPISGVTFSQLSKLDLATRHPLAAQYQGVRVPQVKVTTTIQY